MTAALNGVDGHAQTDGSRLSDLPFQETKLSSKRAPKKLAIGLMPFKELLMAVPYEMDLNHE